MVWGFTTSCYQLGGKKSWFSLGPAACGAEWRSCTEEVGIAGDTCNRMKFFLDHGLAAADINRLAGDAFGWVRGKVANQFGDFIGL